MKKQENFAAAVACVQEVVRAFGEIRLRVFGTSMVPAILPGDVIQVMKVDMSEVALGEIVLWSRDDRLFAHRVVALAGDSQQPVLITRGDRLGHDDPHVGPNELLGRVTAIQRGNELKENVAAIPLSQGGIVRETLARLLGASESATHLYVKLIQLQHAVFTRRIRWQQ